MILLIEWVNRCQVWILTFSVVSRAVVKTNYFTWNGLCRSQNGQEDRKKTPPPHFFSVVRHPMSVFSRSTEMSSPKFTWNGNPRCPTTHNWSENSFSPEKLTRAINKEGDLCGVVSFTHSDKTMTDLIGVLLHQEGKRHSFHFIDYNKL